MKRLLPLAAIEISVWVMLLLCTLLISRVAFQITIGTDSLIDRITTQIVRLLLSGTIILAWLSAWKKTTDTYFWRAIARRKTT